MKIFVLVSRIPWPLEKGDKLRAWHQLRYLSRKHEISLCCLTDVAPTPEAEKQLRTVCADLQIIRLNKPLIAWRLFRAFFSDRPFQVQYFYQSHAARKISKQIASFAPDHIYCQLIRTSEYVKHILDIPKTLDYMDAFNAGHRRRIERSPWYMKPLLREESRRLVAYENLIFDYFDHHTIISIPDRQLLFHPHRDKVVVIPNGVDGKYFSPSDQPGNQYQLVFTGNMGYPPNVDCAQYIVNEVMPLIQKKHPNIKLLLAGATPVAAIRALASEQVIISGWIDDIRDAYRQSSIFIAPMQMGTGLQNKLLEAMSMRLPCITSSLAAGALEGESGTHYLLGETPQEVANQIDFLLTHPVEAQALAARGRSFVLSRFDWEKTVEKLEEVMMKQD